MVYIAYLLVITGPRQPSSFLSTLPLITLHLKLYEKRCLVSVLCLVAQSCLTLCDCMDWCPPGPSVGFPRQEYWSRLLFPSPGYPPDPGIKPVYPGSGGYPGEGNSNLLLGILPTQESNLYILRWQVDSLPLSHQGSPLGEMTNSYSSFVMVVHNLQVLLFDASVVCWARLLNHTHSFKDPP